MNRAEVEDTCYRGDVNGLYAAASNGKNSDHVRRDAYWYLCLLDS